MSFYEDRIFPWFLDLATKPFAEKRKSLVTDVSGVVLELGSGTGANFPFYQQATKVIGIEPGNGMLRETRKRIAAMPVNQRDRFEVLQGSAESLPFDDQYFDNAVVCLVFCTIPDAELAAAELFRVLKPGGKVYVLEHVLSPDVGVAKWQNRINPTWKKVCLGCHINRDTRQTLEAHGLVTEALDEYYMDKAPKIAGRMIEGVFSKPV